MDREMKFVVKISKQRKYKYDLEHELKIHEDLNHDLIHQPSQFARFATMAAEAKAKAEKMEYAVEEYENNLSIELRDRIEKSGKKVTENKIKALIMTDSKRIAMINKMIRAKEQHELVQAAKEAFNHRKDCLISLGANRRAEYEGELSIKDRRRKK